jgi:4'-phosphopantetheinyl transferase
VEICGYKVTPDFSVDLFDNMLEIMDKSTQERVARFKFMEDRQRTLIGNFIVRTRAAHKLGCPVTEIQIERDSHGKPYLRGEPVHFNISHSGDWIVVAFDHMPIGIDIERKKEIRFDIAERYFSDLENEDLRRLDPSLRQDYFFTLWALKESFIKADGRGLALSLSSFSIVADGENYKVQGSSGQCDYFLKTYLVDPGYKLAVCTRHPHFAEQVTLLSAGDFYNECRGVKKDTTHDQNKLGDL